MLHEGRVSAGLTCRPLLVLAMIQAADRQAGQSQVSCLHPVGAVGLTLKSTYAVTPGAVVTPACRWPGSAAPTGPPASLTRSQKGPSEVNPPAPYWLQTERRP